MQCRWLVSLLLVLGTVLYTRTFASFCLLCFFTGTVSCKHLHFSFFLSPLFLLVLFPAPYLHFSLFLSPLFFYRYCFRHTPAFLFVSVSFKFLQVLFPVPHLHFCLFLSPLGFSSGTGVLLGAPALLHVALSVPVHTCTFVWFFYRHWVLLGVCCALHQFKWQNAHEPKDVFVVPVLFQVTINLGRYLLCLLYCFRCILT